MDRGAFLEVLPVSFPQGPRCFPYVLLIAQDFPILVTVDNTTFPFLRVLILSLTSSCFKGMFPLKCVWIPYLPQIFLKFPPVLRCLGWLCGQHCIFPWGPVFCTTAWAVRVLYWVVFLVVIRTIILLVAAYIFTLDFLYGPPGVFTLIQGFPEVL